jgi:hypothetical protein
MQTHNPFWVVGDTEGKIASSLGLFASPHNAGTPNSDRERERESEGRTEYSRHDERAKQSTGRRRRPRLQRGRLVPSWREQRRRAPVAALGASGAASASSTSAARTSAGPRRRCRFASEGRRGRVDLALRKVGRISDGGGRRGPRRRRCRSLSARRSRAPHRISRRSSQLGGRPRGRQRRKSRRHRLEEEHAFWGSLLERATF